MNGLDTHRAAQVIGWISPPKPPRRKPERKPSEGQCKEKAPCGYHCRLTDAAHVLHICNDPDCLCHDRTRYEPGYEDRR